MVTIDRCESQVDVAFDVDECDCGYGPARLGCATAGKSAPHTHTPLPARILAGISDREIGRFSSVVACGAILSLRVSLVGGHMQTNLRNNQRKRETCALLTTALRGVI